MTVEWTNIAIGGGGSSNNPTNNFQIQLFEGSNSINFNYGALTSANGLTTSIGLSGSVGNFLSVTPAATPTLSTTVENSSISSVADLPTGTIYTFTPPASSIAWTSMPAGFTDATEDPGAVSPTVSTTYRVVMTNAVGCTASSTVLVTVNSTSLTTANITNACPVATVNLNTGVTSSTAGLTLQFYTAADLATEITGTGITAAATGTTYYVKATNTTTTCTATASFMATTTTCCVNPIITRAVTNVACFGGATGSITINQTGGDAITTYAWTGSASTTATASGLIAGTYGVTVTAGVGCTASLNMISVGQPSAALTLTQSSTDNTACTTPDGTATFTAAGGTGAYTYTTTAGTAFMVDHGPKTAAHPEFGVGSGTGYSIDGVEGKELTLVRGVTYTFDASMVMGSHPVYITDDAIGAGAGTQYTAPISGATFTFTPTGAMPNLIYYQCGNHANMGWKINLVTPTSASMLTGLSAGDYTTVVTDANGCMATVTATVADALALPSAGLTNDGPLTCTKTSVDLSATGMGTYAYSAVSTGIAAPATYTVTVTATNGCTATATTEVLQDIATPTATLTKSGNLNCANALTGVTLTAGTGAEYDFGAGFTATNTFTAMTATTYTVTVKGANGCTANSSIAVTISASPPVANVMGNFAMCTGASTTLIASAGFTTYAWSGGTAGTSANRRVFNTAGMYSVTITGANGCTTVKTFTTVINSKPTLTSASIPSICAGGDLQGSVTMTSAIAATTTWAAAGGFTATGTTISRNPATTAMSGLYVIRATNACGTTSASATATIKAAMPITVAVNNASTLGGSTGSIYITAPASSTFSWTGSAVTTGTRTGLAAGTYTVTVTPPFGSTYCPVTRIIVIN
jgi:hypothetical protein